MSWTEDQQLRDIDEAFAIEHDCKRGGCPGVLRSTRAELIRHGARKVLRRDAVAVGVVQVVRDGEGRFMRAREQGDAAVVDAVVMLVLEFKRSVLGSCGGCRGGRRRTRPATR